MIIQTARKFLVIGGLAALTLLLTACGGGGRGEVTLTYPQAGTVIYSPVVYVAGTARGADRIRIEVSSAEGVLTETTITPEGESWHAELVHGYSGAPIALTIRVLPVDLEDTAPYASVDVMLAAMQHRPEGAFAYVTMPQDGDSMGGDSIAVVGRISGQTAYALTVSLVGSDGTTLDTQNITLETPYPYDEIPWEVSLTPGTYTGSAVIRVDYGNGESEDVAIVLGTAAG